MGLALQDLLAWLAVDDLSLWWRGGGLDELAVWLSWVGCTAPEKKRRKEENQEEQEQEEEEEEEQAEKEQDEKKQASRTNTKSNRTWQHIKTFA